MCIRDRINPFSNLQGFTRGRGKFEDFPPSWVHAYRYKNDIEYSAANIVAQFYDDFAGSDLSKRDSFQLANLSFNISREEKEN